MDARPVEVSCLAILRQFCGGGTRLVHGDLQHHRMTIADEGLLILRQPRQQREFLVLHRRLDAPQAGPAHQHFVRDKDQAQALFTAFVCQFRTCELIERQQ